MDIKKIALLVSAITVCANLVFAFTGIGGTLSCSVAQNVAIAYAAVMGTTTPQ